MRLFLTESKAELYGNQIDLEYLYLSECDNINEFTCGNEVINDIIKNKLVEDTSTTSFAVINKNNHDIIAIYALSCSGFVVQSANKFHIYPSVEIKYFVINDQYQDIQYCEDRSFGCLSNIIFDKVIADIYEFTENYCGADKIILYSVPSAYEFYNRAGFCDFEEYMLQSDDKFLDGCIPMYFIM